MAKVKPIPAKVEPQPNSQAKLIQWLIIGGTFAAIVILSVVAKGPEGEPPGVVTVAIRIVSLSVLSLIYFWMLYHTRAGREKDAKKAAAEGARGKK
ncbi:MAG: hypothetical protein Kow0099_33540 [Candidatus Abyssubacteria bacterium]